MLKLIPTLASAISSDMENYVKRKRRSLIGFCVACIFALTAYVAGVMAFLEWLRITNDALSSWMIIAVIALAMSIFTLSAVLVFSWHERRKAKRHPSATSSAAFLAAAEMGASTRVLPILITIISGLALYNNNKNTKL